MIEPHIKQSLFIRNYMKKINFLVLLMALSFEFCPSLIYAMDPMRPEFDNKTFRKDQPLEDRTLEYVLEYRVTENLSNNAQNNVDARRAWRKLATAKQNSSIKLDTMSAAIEASVAEQNAFWRDINDGARYGLGEQLVIAIDAISENEVTAFKQIAEAARELYSAERTLSENYGVEFDDAIRALDAAAGKAANAAKKYIKKMEPLQIYYPRNPEGLDPSFIFTPLFLPHHPYNSKHIRNAIGASEEYNFAVREYKKSVDTIYSENRRPAGS